MAQPSAEPWISTHLPTNQVRILVYGAAAECERGRRQVSLDVQPHGKMGIRAAFESWLSWTPSPTVELSFAADSQTAVFTYVSD